MSAQTIQRAAMDDLQLLEDWVTPLISRLEADARKRLGRELMQEVRKDNIKNMRGQRGPDGEKWKGRKKSKPTVPPIRYLYRTLDKRVRELEMSSWRDDGDRLIGYDKEAGGIRTMLKSGMLRKLVPRNGNVNPRQKRLAMHMMVGMSKNRHLAIRINSAEASLEFAGRAERIARIHHFGLRDHVAPGGPEYDYPERPLLGIGPALQDRLHGMILNHLTS